MERAKRRLAPLCLLRRGGLLRCGGLLLCAALAACNSGKSGRSDDQRMASGQVLKGSISDAMLPYDTTKSQPPRAPREASETADKADSAASSEEAASAEAPKPDAAPPSPAHD